RLLLIDGLLDGLSDEQLPGVLQSLRQEHQTRTLIIATGRRDIADQCDRAIRLTAPSRAMTADAAMFGDSSRQSSDQETAE
ncbi:MAG: hypothetical protein KDA89_10885, partial [Planctomycetaceae bacterium]|nr:hypothetical protein [Planctomycetaceae bacterium]